MTTDETQAKEALKKIERLGSSLDHYEQRDRLLKVGLAANIDKNADYVIITGCRPPFALAPLESFIDLLVHFDINYTLLSREVCCGSAMLECTFRRGFRDGRKRRIYESFAQQCLSKNLDQARALGARAVITICAGCNAMWNRYCREQGLDILYYLDLILEVFQGSKLPMEVDFFEGCHRTHNFIPEFQKSIIENSKKVLALIEGLALNEIPSRLCCRAVRQKIYASSQTNTIVTPNACCYTYLTMFRPENGPKVKFLAEILRESLSSTNR